MLDKVNNFGFGDDVEGVEMNKLHKILKLFGGEFFFDGADEILLLCWIR